MVSLKYVDSAVGIPNTHPTLLLSSRKSRAKQKGDVHLDNDNDADADCEEDGDGAGEATAAVTLFCFESDFLASV